jgi:hypothetical protein
MLDFVGENSRRDLCFWPAVRPLNHWQFTGAGGKKRPQRIRMVLVCACHFRVVHVILELHMEMEVIFCK